MPRLLRKSKRFHKRRTDAPRMETFLDRRLGRCRPNFGLDPYRKNECLMGRVLQIKGREVSARPTGKKAIHWNQQFQGWSVQNPYLN